MPKANLMGDLNGGWTIAKRLLQFERNMISDMGGTGGGTPMEELARRYRGGSNDGEIADPLIRDRVARHKMDSHAFSLTLQRAQQTGGGASHLSSFLKYFGTEHNKRRYELLLHCMGQHSLGWSGDDFTPEEQSIARSWLRSKANSIEGGTSEVQLNVIARRVLNLPSGRGN